MSDFPLVEYINPNLQELLDKFFDLSREDHESMQEALARKDIKTLARLGHTAKGTGYGYGFTGMGDIGRAIEDAAKLDDLQTLRDQVDRMGRYLSVVKIKFSE